MGPTEPKTFDELANWQLAIVKSILMPMQCIASSASSEGDRGKE